jgi:two-component system, sensor histidine kinase and response regulator
MYVLDRSAGLKNMAGDSELYQQVLAEYYKENQDTADRLSLAICEKNYAEAAQIVHKVKGSSGSIGASVLYEVSVKLQKALKEENNDEILSLEEEFSDLLNKLLDEIKGSQI